MSNSVDTRVVEMRFDNKQFSAGVQGTLKALNQLNDGLESIQKNDEFEKISKSMASSFTGISRTMAKSASEFEAHTKLLAKGFTVLGQTVLKLKSQIANTFVGWFDDITVKPIMDGLHEYELKMDSIRTIMAGSDEDLKTVSMYLEELNRYADETIYNFADMTTNIGKFTNAGVPLKDSVAAIKGVANWAAISGANANEASRAMYNLAQSLSAGYVKLIDWKSIENANMATVGFKNQLLETAAAMGVLTKTEDGMYKTTKGHLMSATKNFNEFLSDQWLTADVLTRVLADYADETTEIGKAATAAAKQVRTFSKMMDTLKEAAGSGWATTFEHLWGNYDKATEFFTGLSEKIGGAIDNMSYFRNRALESWERFGGQKLFHESIYMVIDDVTKLGSAVVEGFARAFDISTRIPIDLGSKFYQLTKKIHAGIEAFTKALDGPSLVYGKKNIDLVRDAFMGVFSIIKPVISVFKGAFGIVSKLAGPIAEIGLSITGTVGKFVSSKMDSASEFVDRFFKALGQTEFVNKFLKNFIKIDIPKYLASFGQALRGIPSKIKTFATALTKLPIIGPMFRDAFAAFDGFVNSIKDGTVFDKFKVRFDSVVKALGSFARIAKELGSTVIGKIRGNLEPLVNFVKEKFGAIDWDKVTLAWEKFVEWAGGIRDMIVEKITSVFNGEVNVSWSAITEWVKSKLDWIDWDSISLAWSNITTWAGGIRDKIVEKVTSVFNGEVNVSWGPITGWFKEKFDGINWDGISLAWTNITTWAGNVRDKLVEKFKSAFNSDTTIDLSTVTEWFGGIWNKLTTAITSAFGTGEGEGFHFNLEGIVESLKTAWTTITSGIASIFGSGAEGNDAKKVEFNEAESWLNQLWDFVSKSFVSLMTSISQSVEWLSSTFSYEKVLDSIQKFVGLAQALSPLVDIASGIAITSSLSGLGNSMSKFFKSMAKANNRKDADSIGTTLLKISGSIAMLVASLWAINAMTQNDIDDSLIRLGIVIGELVVACGAISLINPPELAGITGFGIAIGLLVGSMWLLSKMDQQTIDTGSKRLAKLIAVIGTALTPFRTIAGSKIDTSGMLSFAAGIAILMIPMVILSIMPPASIDKAMEAITGMALVLGIAAQFFRTFGTSKVSAGGAIALAAAVLIVSVAAAGLGMMDPEKLLRGAAAVSAIAIALGALALLSSGFNSGWNMVGLSLAVGVMAFIVSKLSTLSWNGLGKAAAGIGAIAGIIEVAQLLSKAKINFLTAAANVGQVSLLITEIVGIGAALNALDDATGNFVSANATAIVEKLGELIGAFVSGIGVGTTSQLDKMGKNMTSFAKAFDDINPNSLAGAQVMSDILLALAAANGIGSLADVIDFWLLPDFAKNNTIQKNLSSFANAMKDYGEAIKDLGPVGEAAILGSQTAAEMLLGLAQQVPKGNSLWGLIAGVPDWNTMNTGLTGFAGAMASYSDALKGKSFNNITQSKAAADLLMSLASKVPKGNSLVGWIIGRPDWGNLNDGLPKFAKAMSEYSDALGDKNFSNVTKAKGAAELLMSLGSEVPKDFGLIDLITDGSKKWGWDTLNSNIPLFADAMSKFSTTIAGMSFGNLNEAKALGDLMMALAVKVPADGGLFGLIGGTNAEGWKSLNSGLPDFGKALSKFSRNASSIRTEDADKMFDFASKAIGWISDLPTDGGWLAFFKDDTVSFDKLGFQIESFGSSLATFANSYSTIQGADDVSAMLGLAEAIILMSKDLGNDTDINVDNFTELARNMTIISELFGGMAQQLYDDHTLEGVGDTMAKGFLNGIDAAIASEINGQIADIGGYIATGLANGMRLKTYIVTAAARYMSTRALEVIQDIFRISSPSRVMEEFGMFVDMGFANGMEKYGYLSENAAGNMADAVLDNATDMLGILSTTLSEGVDPTIRIRPVLDLGDISAGMNRMNGMLGNRTLGITTGNNLAGNIIASDPSKKTPTGLIDAVNDRIDSLADTIAGMNLVLDSGKLVGGIVNDVDRRLGNFTKQKLRGV